MTLPGKPIILACLLSAFFSLWVWQSRAAGPVELSISPVRFEYTGYAGEQRRGTLWIANGTDEPLDVFMEVEDFLPVGEEGQIAVGRREDFTLSIRDWVSFSQQHFTVSPRSRLPVDFTIDAPVGAEVGTHYGTILAVTETVAGDGTGAAVVTKVGAVVHFDIYGEYRESLLLSHFSVPPRAWKTPVTVALRFENHGTVRAKPRGALVVQNVFGKEVANVPMPEYNVLPGMARRFSASIEEGLWAGRYSARLEGSYGLTNEIPIEAEVTFWFVDWKNVGLPFLILFGTFLFLLSRHKNVWPALSALKRGKDLMPNP